MQPRLTFITLGVKDLDRSKRFYSDVLGWKPFQDSGIVMYKLNGMILSLFPQHELAEDAQVKDEGKGSRFTLAQCLRSTEEVDALFAELKEHLASAKAAGEHGKMTITKEPVKVFWGGYSGYFADPDGHLWEVAHNPFLEMDAAGNVVGMKQG
jgi:catechol 2,3-dioxygenase-like lactoylglutathione lyase family enzyme